MKKFFAGVLPLLIGVVLTACSSSDDEPVLVKTPEVNETVELEENITVPEVNETVEPEENITAPEVNKTVEPEEVPEVPVVENNEINTTIAPKNIAIPLCEDEEYETLQSGDKIIHKSDEPEVELIHNQDNIKRICLVSGEAEIERTE